MTYILKCETALRDNITFVTEPVVCISPDEIPPLNYDRSPYWAGMFMAIFISAILLLSQPMFLTADMGSFSFTGQAAEIYSARQIPSATGPFNLSGISASLNYTHYAPFPLQLELNTIATSAWDCAFNSVTLTVSGDGDIENGELQDNNCTATVFKTTNAGITEAGGGVQFYKNAALQDTQSFSFGDNLNGTPPNYIQYTFLSLSEGDSLKVIINENLAP